MREAGIVLVWDVLTVLFKLIFMQRVAFAECMIRTTHSARKNVSDQLNNAFAVGLQMHQVELFALPSDAYLQGVGSMSTSSLG